MVMPSPNMMRIFKIDDGVNTNSYPIRDSHINIAYGECTTPAATSDKIVNIDSNIGWLLRAGSMVIVYFTYSVQSNATLNVGDTGAKSVYQNGQAIADSIILAGDTATFVYDGTNYLLVAIDRVGSEINNKLNIGLKGSANGLAELDGSGKVPANQLPSYVDDVLEFDSLSMFPVTGEDGKIYVAKDVGITYRWTGTQYIRLDTYDIASQASSGLMSSSDKTKLDTDVLTKSQQSLTSSDKEQIYANLGLGESATKDVVNDLTSTEAGSVLDARQGKALSDLIDDLSNSLGDASTQAVANNLTTNSSGSVLDARQGKTLNDIKAKVNALAIDGVSGTAPKAITKGQYVYWNNGLYRASTDISSGTTLSTSNLVSIGNGVANLLYDFFNAVGIATYAISDLTASYTSMGNSTYSIVEVASNSTDAPSTGSGIVIIYKSSAAYGAEVFISNTGMWYRRNHNGWKEWIGLNDAVKADDGGYLTSVLSNNDGTVRPRSIYYAGSCVKNATVSLGKLRTGAIVFVSNNSNGLDICFKSSANGFHKATTNNTFTISAVEDECSITNSGNTVYISVIS